MSIPDHSEPPVFAPESATRKRLNETAPACSECDGVGVYVTGREIYPHRPDLYAKGFYRCACGAYVGCHPGTKNALGTLAGAKTRRARSTAHSAFDPLWKRGPMKRSAAYKALAAELNIRPRDCHISWFDAAKCAQVVAAVARIQTAPTPDDGDVKSSAKAGSGMINPLSQAQGADQ